MAGPESTPGGSMALLNLAVPFKFSVHINATKRAIFYFLRNSKRAAVIHSHISKIATATRASYVPQGVEHRNKEDCEADERKDWQIARFIAQYHSDYKECQSRIAS